MRTARANGTGVSALARWDSVQRGTVWEKTRRLDVPAQR